MHPRKQINKQGAGLTHFVETLEQYVEWWLTYWKGSESLQLKDLCSAVFSLIRKS